MSLRRLPEGDCLAIEIGLTEFTLDVPALPARELREYTSRLFDLWEAQLSQNLSLPDYALRLEVVEGSLKGRARISAAALGIFAVVTAAGGFISGVKELRWAVQKAGTLLAREAAAPYVNSQSSISVRRGTGRLGELERIIGRVQNGQLDRREAAILVQSLFDDGDEEPGLEELRNMVLDTVASVPRAPTQLVFPLEEFETLLSAGKQSRIPTLTKPPSTTVPHHFRRAR